jgi:hypothetical protein
MIYTNLGFDIHNREICEMTRRPIIVHDSGGSAEITSTSTIYKARSPPLSPFLAESKDWIFFPSKSAAH